MRCDITHFQADFRPKERHFSSQKFERSGCAWNLLNQTSAKRKISLTHKQLIDDQFHKIFSDTKLKTEQNQTKEKLRTEVRKMYFCEEAMSYIYFDIPKHKTTTSDTLFELVAIHRGFIPLYSTCFPAIT